jgi:hypothetical protein
MEENNESTDAQQTPSVRKGEAEKHWFRSDRFFKVGNDWFFTTRENRDVGPYTTQPEASQGLQLFIECLTKRDSDVDHAVSVATTGTWAVTGFQ